MRDHRHTWAWLFGAACPGRGAGAAVVLPHVDVEAMNIHPAEVARRVARGAHAVLVLDGAGWHTSPKLRVPENINLLRLPRCAPQLAPVETLREFLRADFLSHRAWDSYRAVVNACRHAWNALMTTPGHVTSTTRPWAQVSVWGAWC